MLFRSKPDIVVVGFDTTLTYIKLEKACSFIRNGAIFYATHPDINCPVENGFIPDVGSFCAAISLSTGVTPKIFGKPHVETLESILDNYKSKKEEIAFVGDRLYTDVAEGVENGSRGILVLTGETKKEDILSSDIQPDAVFDSLGEMGALLTQIADLEGVEKCHKFCSIIKT